MERVAFAVNSDIPGAEANVAKTNDAIDNRRNRRGRDSGRSGVAIGVLYGFTKTHRMSVVGWGQPSAGVDVEFTKNFTPAATIHPMFLACLRVR
jgi:hypothetical protein